MADGQVTQGGTVVKPNVKKTRKIGEHAIGGFAGATADAFTLLERLETKLEEHPGEEGVGGRRRGGEKGALARGRPPEPAVWGASTQLHTRSQRIAAPLQASSRARRWSWPRCGAWTSTCAGWT